MLRQLISFTTSFLRRPIADEDKASGRIAQDNADVKALAQRADSIVNAFANYPLWVNILVLALFAGIAYIFAWAEMCRLADAMEAAEISASNHRMLGYGMPIVVAFGMISAKQAFNVAAGMYEGYLSKGFAALMGIASIFLLAVVFNNSRVALNKSEIAIEQKISDKREYIKQLEKDIATKREYAKSQSLLAAASLANKWHKDEDTANAAAAAADARAAVRAADEMSRDLQKARLSSTGVSDKMAMKGSALVTEIWHDVLSAAFMLISWLSTKMCGRLIYIIKRQIALGGDVMRATPELVAGGVHTAKGATYDAPEVIAALQAQRPLPAAPQQQPAPAQIERTATATRVRPSRAHLASMRPAMAGSVAVSDVADDLPPLPLPHDGDDGDEAATATDGPSVAVAPATVAARPPQRVAVGGLQSVIMAIVADPPIADGTHPVAEAVSTRSVRKACEAMQIVAGGEASVQAALAELESAGLLITGPRGARLLTDDMRQWRQVTRRVGVEPDGPAASPLDVARTIIDKIRKGENNEV